MAVKRKRKPYVSTVVPMTHQPKGPKWETAKEKQGITQGMILDTPGSPHGEQIRVIQLARIGKDPWRARVAMSEGGEMVMPLSELVALRKKSAKAFRQQGGRREKAPAPRRPKAVKTTTHTVQTRIANPRKRRQEFALVAQAPGRKRRGRRRRLRYSGTNFSDHAKPALFTSLRQVATVANGLRRKFGHALRKYSLYAEPHAVKP